MKNSGSEIQKEIPFIESIPKNWRLIPNRWLFKEDGKKVGADWEKYQLLSLTTTGVKERNIDDVGGKVPTSYENYQTVKKGQMIFCLFDLDCSAVFSGISKYNGMITSAYDVFSATDLITNNYIDYWFRYIFSNRYYMMYSKNIRYSVASDIFKGLKTPVPPISKQQRIAEVLDEKCGKIDKLIENEQKQIEKMKEYKQSVITCAVTKGLDKSAPLKDSGIDWIGEIPKSWRVCPLKYCVQANMESLSEKEDDNLPVNYIDISSVNNCGEINNIQEFLFKDAPSRARRIVKAGDIIISTVRTYLKAIAKITDEYSDCICSTGFAVLTPNNMCDKNFLYYALFSNVFTSKVETYSNGISYPAINCGVLVSLSIILPSIEEQKQIADYLDEKCGKIDEVISIKQRKIEKLQEYKKSLIYEYVTGKKEVG